MDYDLFNGDADGICSLIQLRLADPRDSELVTGIKRNIKLFDQVKPESGDRITALDISMEKNQAGLSSALEAGASVFYADHHRSGDIPEHPNLTAHINLSADTCTSVIVDGHLQGRYREWAIVGAFGDNMLKTANVLCETLSTPALTSEQIKTLRDLGVLMNYNGYGASIDDLFYHPSELYRLASRFESPLEFVRAKPEVFRELSRGFESDMSQGLGISPLKCSDQAAMILLPDEPWARRISGVLGNELANQYPDRAHAILTEREEQVDGKPTYQVSIRAPKNNLTGADTIAMKFGGGGRKGAAGIDRLLHAEIEALWAEFL